MGEDVAFKFLANTAWNFNLSLVLASKIQISCPCSFLLPLRQFPFSENMVSVSSASGNFWHGNHHHTMKHFLFMYIESRQCALDLKNPSQNCLKCSILKEGIDTNVKNQWQRGWCHPKFLIPTWQALSMSRCMWIRFCLTYLEKRTWKNTIEDCLFRVYIYMVVYVSRQGEIHCPENKVKCMGSYVPKSRS